MHRKLACGSCGSWWVKLDHDLLREQLGEQDLTWKLKTRVTGLEHVKQVSGEGTALHGDLVQSGHGATLGRG